ncbi:MAG: fibronectin type III domain-containing protein [Bacteroidales bacterium]|nr:fibronectin type III domain-containing protein [Bacteroidales bacterium]
MMKKSLLLTIMLLSAVLGGTACADELTVYDDTDTHDKIPLYGDYADVQGSNSEFIIPDTELGEMVGKMITGLKFYLSTPATSEWEATYIVYLKIVEATTISELTGPDQSTTPVYTGTLDGTGEIMEIVFDEGFPYSGGNLLVGTYVQTEGNYEDAEFYGLDTSATEWGTSYNSDDNDTEGFLPKTTFIFEAASSCLKPSGVAAVATNVSATISWSSSSNKFNIKYKKTADPDVEESWKTTTSTTTSCLLDDLDSETEYEVQVQADCGGGDYSDWTSSVMFTTLEAHPIPTNINVTSITNTSSHISWIGYDESYTLAYRNSPYFIKEGFEGGVIPAGWTDNRWYIASGDKTGEIHPHTGDYNILSDNNHTSIDDFLITPEMDLSYITEAYLSCYYINREEWDEFDEEYKNDFFGIYYRINGGAWTELFYTTEAHESWTNITIASLSGLADHYQIGFKFTANYGCGVGLDDIIIGITGSDPSWNTENNNITNEYIDLCGLGSGSYYEVKVKNNYNVDYSDSYVFNTLPNVYTTTSDWDDIAVTSIDNVRISADVTIPDGTVAIANHITIDGGSLTIEDGGQLIASNSVAATVKKTIADPTKAEDYGHWYTISTPVHKDATDNVVISETNLTTMGASNYDMFYFDEAQGMWINQKTSGTGFSNMYVGKGYLYRNDGTDLVITGNTNSGDIEYTLTKDGSGDIAGFNLIGNPYPHDINLKHITYSKGENLNGCYILSDAGAWGSELDGDATISSYQGFLVQADVDDKVAIFHETAQRGAKSNGDNIKFMVANSQYEDVAYALFDKGFGLSKINHRNADIPKLYINQEDTDYAIATMSDDTKSFNLNFKAMTTGKYTLSYKADGNFSYLHVIDRLTGEDVDMLLEGKYSFIASPIDSENRFIVRLEYSAGSEISESSIFAYQSGNDIIVNGEGELQIFDMMGRRILTQYVSGVETINLQSHGVYIFKLNEKTQKIVVR